MWNPSRTIPFPPTTFSPSQETLLSSSLCLHTNTHVDTCSQCTHTHGHTCVCMQAHTHAQKQICMHSHAHMLTCVHTHTHMHTYCSLPTLIFSAPCTCQIFYICVPLKALFSHQENVFDSSPSKRLLISYEPHQTPHLL